MGLVDWVKSKVPDDAAGWGYLAAAPVSYGWDAVGAGGSAGLNAVSGGSASIPGAPSASIPGIGTGGESLDQATQNINAQVALANASAQKSQAAASGVFTDVNAAKSNAIMAAQGAASARAAAAANPNDLMLQA